MEYAILALCTLSIIALIIVIYMIYKKSKSNGALSSNDINNIKEAIKEENNEDLQRFLSNLDNKLDAYNKVISEKNKSLFEKYDIIINNLNSQISSLNKDFNEFKEKIIKENNESFKTLNNETNRLFKEFNESLKAGIALINNSLNDQIKNIREDNEKKLDQINESVNKKLESAIESKLKQSFENLVEQISGVNKAIGEIKGIANDVGSLKTVLTNVKTKGIVGEIILGNIIKEIFTPSQYEENFITKKNSSERVEFAIKLPGKLDNEYVYLPIDSKLPLEAYTRIKEGVEEANPEKVKEARKELRSAVKTYAKDIKNKYIDVPNTTDFAVMFLPIEGLYLEALDIGLFEEIQKEYKVNIVGPTTLTAFLNSLSIGFKTLVIQKRSADVFRLLGAIKTEFTTFSKVLEKAQTRINQTSTELETLVGTRTRMIVNKLNQIESVDEIEASKLIEK